jgi:hypothetical protein
VFTVLGLAAPAAHALPSINPHPHTLVGWSDPALGGPAVNHHHWTPGVPLYPGNGVICDETANSPIKSVGKPFVNCMFDAYSAWDQAGNQALYRNGDAVPDFGHGFIRGAVPFLMEGGVNGVPFAAATDINVAFTQWENQTQAAFAANPLSAHRVLGFDFGPGAAEDVNLNGILDFGEDANGNALLDGFTIEWVEAGIAGAVAQWLPGSQLLQFDGTVNWFFGGAGLIPVGMTDFFTIAMHEIGHIVGLNHINTGVPNMLMRSDIIVQATAAGTPGLRVADAGSIEGALALYVQVAEPATLGVLMLGFAVVFAVRRRRAA